MSLFLTFATMNELVEILHERACSLVLRDTNGDVTTYDKPGVRDLIWLLDNDPSRLQGACVADKVVGKAAAGLMLRGGVDEVYGTVMSRQALPLLNDANVKYSYGTLVERIVQPVGDNRCPLELIVRDATTASQVEHLLREHFAERRLTMKSDSDAENVLS